MTAATRGVSREQTRSLRIGTRRSALARAQSGQIATALCAAIGRQVSLVDIDSHGDRDPRPLTEIGGGGVFVAALRAAVLAGDVDLAVHSLKDLPTLPADGLVLAAVPQREDPRDVLVATDGRRLADLPVGARIGTGSPRRAQQLAALRADVVVIPVRGNVDTRLRKVAEGELDAVVLARAGLARLGRLGDITETFEPEAMLPAPGQGALAVECRTTDVYLVEQVATALDDAAARAAVTAERALLATLEAGCSAPVGALAEASGGVRLRLRAVAGEFRRERTGEMSSPVELGRDLAQQLLADGAGPLITNATREK